MDTPRVPCQPEPRHNKGRLLHALVLVAVTTCMPLANLAVCDAGIVSAGQRVRYLRSRGESHEATVIVAANDTMIVSYEVATYTSVETRADTVLLSSLESLEVRLERLNMLAGFVGGVMLGGIVGGAVAELALARYRGEVTFVRPWMIGAPLGALLGGVFGTAFAHDRGMRWKRMPLPRQ